MQIRCNIKAQQREETAYRKSLITIPQHLIIHRMFVKQVAQKTDHTVHRNHEQDPDDVLLLVGAQVVGCVHVDEPEGDDDGDEAEDGGEEEAEVVEGEAFPEGGFGDDGVFEGGVAGGHCCGALALSARGSGAAEGVCAIAVVLSLMGFGGRGGVGGVIMLDQWQF